MCDTMGILNKQGGIFAKNSDRSPNECQVIELLPAIRHEAKKLKVTYMEIPQVEHTYGMLLSRPAWMWGAEIGVNQCGVCIGNEALFTKGSYGKTGLTGMDLLRLALERAGTAKEALSVIIDLLEQYGQGGNCGFDHDFYYDNSFLIMDRAELYVLETKDRHWVYKCGQKAAISNVPGIRRDGDAYSDGEVMDFAGKYTNPLYTRFAGAKQRRQACEGSLAGAKSAGDLFRALRTHAPGVHNPFTQGSVKSPCMHAGGLAGDHTTSSMVVELKETPVVWITGSSTPCVSLFKPYLYGNEPVAPVIHGGDKKACEYWLTQEKFRRKLIGGGFPENFFVERDAMEQDWLREAGAAYSDAERMLELSRESYREEQELYSRYMDQQLNGSYGSTRYKRYWAKKNMALFDIQE